MPVHAHSRRRESISPVLLWPLCQPALARSTPFPIRFMHARNNILFWWFSIRFTRAACNFNSDPMGLLRDLRVQITSFQYITMKHLHINLLVWRSGTNSHYYGLAKFNV